MTKIDVIETAVGEIGYCEKASRAMLDDPKKNAGDKNFTKYARDVAPEFQAQPWCMLFVNWCFQQAYGKETANKLLCGQLRNPSTMSVKDAFDKRGQLVPLSMAQPGDIVFRSRNGGGHTGIVKANIDGHITTIEGNSTPSDPTSWNGGEVCEHTDAAWMWCARPDWSLLPRYENLGWNKDAVGWWYAVDDRTFLRSEWAVINHCRYYFNDRGYAVTGEQTIDGERFYFEPTPNAAKECALLVTNEDGALMLWHD